MPSVSTVSMHRLRSLAVFAVLVALAAAVVVYALSRDSTRAGTAAACPTEAVPFETALVRPDRITVAVYNATERPGLASTVRTQLVRSGFRVARVGNAPTGSGVAGVAELRFGPAGAGAAQVLRSWLVGARTKLDDRAGTTVEVFLGDGFSRVATPAESAAVLKRLGPPKPPASC